MRSLTTAAGRGGSSAAAVPGRGEKANTCARPKRPLSSSRQRAPERGLVLGGKPDDHVGAEHTVAETRRALRAAIAMYCANV